MSLFKASASSSLAIPDGYLIDFTLSENPRLYISEIELSSHDPYKHIGSQMLEFDISYKIVTRKFINLLQKHC